MQDAISQDELSLIFNFIDWDIFFCLRDSLSILQLPKLCAFGHTRMRQDAQFITVYIFLYLYCSIFFYLRASLYPNFFFLKQLILFVEMYWSDNELSGNFFRSNGSTISGDELCWVVLDFFLKVIRIRRKKEIFYKLLK